MGGSSFFRTRTPEHGGVPVGFPLRPPKNGYPQQKTCQGWLALCFDLPVLLRLFGAWRVLFPWFRSSRPLKLGDGPRPGIMWLDSHDTS